MLNRACFALGQLVGDGALDEEETAAALLQSGQTLALGTKRWSEPYSAV